MRKISTMQKVLLSATAVTTAAGLAAAGTYADWTQTSGTAKTQSVTTGTLVVDLGATGANTFGTAIGNMAPGDTFQRLIDLHNTGSLAWSKLDLAYTLTGLGAANLTNTSGAGDVPVAITVDNCATAWTGSAGSYSCASPGSTNYVAQTAFSNSGATFHLVDVAGSINAGDVAAADTGTDHLLFTYTLPSTNTDYTTYGGQTMTVNWIASATQRAAKSNG